MKTIKIDEKKKIIVAFLLKCNSYSEDRIKSYRSQIFIDQETQKKIEKWMSYMDFNLHAVSELEKKTLDHWFN